MLEALDVPTDRFDEALEALVVELDAEDCDLEVLDPSAWRRPTEGIGPISVAGQFRMDVNAIQVMDRDQEMRLAKRLQFCRLRLQRAGLAVGASSRELEALMLSSAEPQCALERRAQELQRLRVEFVERNLYLVLINVERHAKRGGSREDLLQEGCIALFRAVDRFDWKRGLLFRTYAVHWLNQAFRSYLYNNANTVRVPVYLQKAIKHIRQASVQLGKEDATPEELAERSGLTPSLVSAAMTAARGSHSLDAFLDREEGSSLADVLEDQEAPWGYSTRLESTTLVAGLERALVELPERDRRVIEMRFGIGQERESTLAEVAKRYGISLERVRQIQARALRNLGTARVRRELEPFLN